MSAHMSTAVPNVEYIVMFELSGSVKTAVPADHITASASTPAHSNAAVPRRRKNTHTEISTNAALIAAAVSNGPAVWPRTRTGSASK